LHVSALSVGVTPFRLTTGMASVAASLKTSKTVKTVLAEKKVPCRITDHLATFVVELRAKRVP
jgi:hypothetical protein